jgi:hypothetical protein
MNFAPAFCAACGYEARACLCDDVADIDVCVGCGRYFGDFGEVCRRHREAHPESTILPAQHCARCRRL